jgi:hypothetical protein
MVYKLRFDGLFRPAVEASQAGFMCFGWLLHKGKNRIAYGFERVRVWNHGVDAQRYHPAKRSARWRMKLMDGQTDQKLLL